MLKDDLAYLKKIIEKGEDTQLDFKFEISDSVKIAETFSAFANTEGGNLLLGVKDNGSIAGVRSEEELYMVESAIALCRPKVNLNWQNLKAGKKTVVEIKIRPSINKPVYAKNTNHEWIAYYRLRDQNIVLPEVLKKIWLRGDSKKNVVIEYSEKERWLLTFLTKKPTITPEELSVFQGIGIGDAEDCLADLTALNIIKPECKHNNVYFSLVENIPVT